MKFRAFARTYDAPFATHFLNSTGKRTDTLIEFGDVEPTGDLLHHAFDFPGGPSVEISRDAETTFVSYRDMRCAFSHPERLVFCGEFENKGTATRWLERVFLPIHLLLTQPETIAFHASSVVVESRGTVLLGESGVGKSTLAFELVRRGAKLLTDDLVLVVGETIVGGAPTVRTWDRLDFSGIEIDEPASPEGTKRWLKLADEYGVSETVQLQHVFLIERGEAFEVREISGAEKVTTLLSQTFAFTDGDFSESRFAKISAFARAHTVMRCTIPSDQRQQTIDAIWRLL